MAFGLSDDELEDPVVPQLPDFRSTPQRSARGRGYASSELGFGSLEGLAGKEDGSDQYKEQGTVSWVSGYLPADVEADFANGAKATLPKGKLIRMYSGTFADGTLPDGFKTSPRKDGRYLIEIPPPAGAFWFVYPALDKFKTIATSAGYLKDMGAGGTMTARLGFTGPELDPDMLIPLAGVTGEAVDALGSPGAPALPPGSGSAPGTQSGGGGSGSTGSGDGADKPITKPPAGGDGGSNVGSLLLAGLILWAANSVND